jgi:hypothetical protein
MDRSVARSVPTQDNTIKSENALVKRQRIFEMACTIFI